MNPTREQFILQAMLLVSSSVYAEVSKYKGAGKDTATEAAKKSREYAEALFEQTKDLIQ